MVVPLAGPGCILREERLSKSLTLDEISRQTRISARSLEAIETEHFDRLPGVVFTRNFVRQYAIFLGLDPDPLLAQLPRVDIESAPLPVPPPNARRRWDPRVTSALASLGWLAVASGAAVAAYVHYNRPEPLPRRFTAPAAKPAPEAAQPIPAAAAITTTPEPVQTQEAQPLQVVLRAHEASWVKIIADGKAAFTGILKPSDSRSIGAESLVRVTAGNAGGIEISLNGKAIEAIGPSGQVRTVRLTAEGPQLESKTPPPAPDPI